MCNRARIDFVDTPSELSYLAGLFNLTCNDFALSSVSAAPYISETGRCFFSNPGVAKCNVAASATNSRRFCCCALSDRACPLPPPVKGWVVSDLGQTCDSTCGKLRNCHANVRNLVDSGDLLEEIVHIHAPERVMRCLQDFPIDSGTAPAFANSGACRIPNGPGVSECATSSTGFYQLCCCGRQRDCPLGPYPDCEIAKYPGTEGGLRVHLGLGVDFYLDASLAFVDNVAVLPPFNNTELNDDLQDLCDDIVNGTWYSYTACLLQAVFMTYEELPGLALDALFNFTEVSTLESVSSFYFDLQLDFGSPFLSYEVLENVTLPSIQNFLGPDLSTSFSFVIPYGINNTVSAGHGLELNATVLAADPRLDFVVERLCDYLVTSSTSSTTSTFSTASSTSSTTSTWTSTSTSTTNNETTAYEPYCVTPPSSSFSNGTRVRLQFESLVTLEGDAGVVDNVTAAPAWSSLVSLPTPVEYLLDIVQDTLADAVAAYTFVIGTAHLEEEAYLESDITLSLATQLPSFFNGLQGSLDLRTVLPVYAVDIQTQLSSVVNGTAAGIQLDLSVGFERLMVYYTFERYCEYDD